MGLLDILTGMQNGPRGQRQPSDSGGSGGGMSPVMMALLGLLAYKALKSGALGNILGGDQPTPPGGADRPASLPPGGTAEAGSAGGGRLGDLLGGLLGGGPGGARPGGSLNDLIPGGLGGLLGGAAAGNVLTSGLGSLIQDLQNSGQGRTAQSWVSPGPNQEIAPEDLEPALGTDTLDTLSKQTGMKRDELLTELSQQLPGFVDQLTPQGRLPTEEEASRMV